MSSGLILLGLLAVLVAYFWTRLRRKAGLGVTGKHWAGAIVVFAIAALLLWATNSH